MSTRAQWPRSYGPLCGLGVALALVVTVLPSALNVPLSNPTTTPEFAPVPPQDDNNPPPALAGNVAGVGFAQPGGRLGAVPTSTSGEPGALPPGSPGGEALGKQPSSKECVGNPPRQTEDLLSPPCVGYFAGDNGGATHTGVSATEITTLFVYDSGSGPTGAGPTSRGSEDTPPPGTYVDLLKPPSGDEMIFLRELRLWQRYFNQRYQTYGRRAHFWAYFADGNVGTPEARRADAVANFAKLHPFAVFSRLSFNAIPYAEASQQKGVMNIGGYRLRPAASFETHPQLSWAFVPSVEQRAKSFTALVCRKVKPYRAGFSGNPGDNGKPRRYGLVYEEAPQTFPEYSAYRKSVEAGLARCGVRFGDDRFSEPLGPDQATQSQLTMAKFKQDGVTTVISVAGNFDQLTLVEATNVSFYPEWLFAGDGRVEGTQQAQQYDQEQMTHAWVVTPQTLYGREGVSAPCADAVHSLDPSVPQLDMIFYCSLYDDLRQYFTAIQVAGPRLSPATVDQGFRAIPPHTSSSPDLPACYYDLGDYTCVKDAIAEWWDPAGGNAVTRSAGCWRAVTGGRRYRADQWATGDLKNAKNTATDPCNTFLYNST